MLRVVDALSLLPLSLPSERGESGMEEWTEAAWSLLVWACASEVIETSFRMLRSLLVLLLPLLVRRCCAAVFV